VFPALKELVGADHIVFGTDYPMRPENGVAGSIEVLKAYAGFNNGEKQTIRIEAAQALFPRFC